MGLFAHINSTGKNKRSKSQNAPQLGAFGEDSRDMRLEDQWIDFFDQ
jgi:hypothetical protein